MLSDRLKLACLYGIVHPNRKFEGRKTHLMYSVSNSQTSWKKFKTVLESTQNIDFQDDKGWTALMAACSHMLTNKHSFDFINALIANTSNINLYDSAGRTALTMCIIFGRNVPNVTSIIKLLIDRGINIEMCDPVYHLNPIVFYCAYSRYFDDQNLHTLLQHSADPNCNDAQKATALIYAILFRSRESKMETVKILINYQNDATEDPNCHNPIIN